MPPTLKQVIPLEGHRLHLFYDNGEERVFDVTPYLGTGVFRDLKDAVLFRTVRVSFDTVEWDNSADLCPEVLYENSAPSTSTDLKVAEARSQYKAKD